MRVEKEMVGRWAHLYTFLAQILIAVLMILLSLLAGWSGKTPIMLGLATLGSALALLYPMRLREDRGTTRILILSFFILFAILVFITALDVATRYLTERPSLTG